MPALPKIVSTYNSRKHSSIGISPENAEKPENASIVSYNLEKNVYMKRLKRPHKRRAKFYVGEKVRIQEDRTLFSRSWSPYFRLKVYG